MYSTVEYRIFIHLEHNSPSQTPRHVSSHHTKHLPNHHCAEHVVCCAEQSARVNPFNVPPLIAFAHLLNWTSHDRCTAAALFANVFPLTENGREASPVSRMAGAAMPPIAVELLAVDEAADNVVAVAVLLENGAFDEVSVGSAETDEDEVIAGASTVTVPVTTEQTLEAESSSTARDVV